MNKNVGEENSIVSGRQLQRTPAKKLEKWIAERDSINKGKKREGEGKRVVRMDSNSNIDSMYEESSKNADGKGTRRGARVVAMTKMVREGLTARARGGRGRWTRGKEKREQ